MTPDEPRRPDPDALLAATRAGQGRLKVFLGMSPGVGKTYEMLRAARRRKAEGGDVVVGVVESHGRKETQSLLRGLDVMARTPIDHRGRTLMEFDLDAALARKPGLLLVDEYAHSNAPGSRHPKRWQDVEELLAAGIDVWTTLNVQHLESLVDVVWKITGVRQRETVPDRALSDADEIELIDITPAELRERMAEGKVYVPETARLAADRFFKTENLTALRELALRRAAQTVDDQLIGAMKRAGVEGPWAAGERILVLAGPDATAASLVRAGRRLSDMMMDAPWTVAHVERPNGVPLSPHAAQKLREALKLAEQLGGTTISLTGDDVVGSVLDYARRNNTTQIVVGKTRRRRLPFRRSLVHALLEEARGAALHVITESAEPHVAEPGPRPSLRDIAWRGHLGALTAVAMAGGIAWMVDRYVESANLAMVFMLSVLVSGLAFGLWPAVTAATASAFAYNFFFLEPRLTVSIGHPADVLTFGVFFAVAMTTGWLTGRVRDQARAVSRRAAGIAAVLSATRRLSSAAKADDAALALAEQLAAATSCKAVVLTPEGEDLRLAAASPALDALSAGDMAAARWAWEKGEAAGAGTGTLPNAGWVFRPLQGVKTRAGVVGIEPQAIATEDGERFVAALLDQGAVALERAELAAAAADTEALRRTDRLRSALLNSVSHDLRTPLSTVLGSATTLIDYGKSLTAKVRDDLLLSIREEAERLNRYVGDLLDMTRLEGGALVTRREWTDARDVLRAAVDRVTRRLEARKVIWDFPDQVTLVMADGSLLEQALVNILENAITYSPDGTTIDVSAYEDRNNVVISIEDEGRGIPTPELERVFEKFRRMDEATDRGKGAGLGLAISKGFVEAMGGRIAAASPIHDGRGTRILISLPKERPTPGMLP
ncbi:MAG: sensor histidine kinase KdpD [Alphaproteobacteria bacterium]|nr:sensor histidine kinase KdpD [Alphaproteobacteria bacterium]MBU1516916.1 sensor histidine kinase KdpD [Alphaproteobacteria bacterium]MBU2095804.1 sensor histidine kinase KdpD [Alphaproteobacteria bacterium]MBU2152059.1 sensor histidine kinase KdpD [Alphaproteobacteria bacterium]MBU2309580.1 sensor histidine kinase KdpD [Alphaproteobacteria bacterium]